MGLLGRIIGKKRWPRAMAQYDSATAYERLIAAHIANHPGNRDLAFSLAVGSLTIEGFRAQGDGHVAVLKAHGLTDGMAIFDLGCGCGRTAQALQRSGWRGQYTGTDIVTSLIEEFKAKCPDYTALVHRRPDLPVRDASLDMVFHWSVFTHIPPEECYLYMVDSYRAMKPGARMVFSFMEITEPAHQDVFFRRANGLNKNAPDPILDVFLHRDWIDFWAQRIGFSQPEYTEGSDGSRHPAFWQTLVAMDKPAA